MEYDSVAILLTEDCNAKCKMCCDSRGEVKGKTITKSEIDIIMNNIKENDNINTIGITGGEPMLYPELCQYIFDYPLNRNVSYTIKTNGFWGSNPKKAEEFIKKNRLKLKEISFSYDEFHREYISLGNIKKLIDICNDYKIPTNIVGCFLKNGTSAGEILDELGEYAYLTEFFYQPVLKVGSANDFEDSDFMYLLDSNKHDIKCIAYTRKDYTLLIDAKLNVYPCCSQFIEDTIFNIGNLKNESLDEIIDTIKYNKVFYKFFTCGFKPFIEFMKENSIEFPNKITSHCEMCHYLFSNNWFLEKLTEKNYFENNRV